ncbi:single-stranded DNA-binding protein [Pumilibacter intestinalis]|uniref:single-stranded DNA-binding protein n=1 Tax=Pumilibacter intestinalis TaxID=2941511 RepID=UPI00203C70C4|nr:single-stranded DNA-binding protein [Pumilibacter intestinalis]MCI8487876.1 single-stranded DNA-binding protein [Clostridia bacterium]
MNKCILVGNLTRDPELTQTTSGVSMCRFSIAVNRSYANANGEREADFINIVTWRGLAENCGKYLAKGRKVAVCGSIQTRSYDDKDGNRRYATDVVADDVEFIGGGNSDGGASPAPERSAAPKKLTSELKPIEDDGLPF